MDSEKAYLISKETFKIFQERATVTFNEALEEAKRIYGVN